VLILGFPDGGAEQHVAAAAADFLVAPQQALRSPAGGAWAA